MGNEDPWRRDRGYFRKKKEEKWKRIKEKEKEGNNKKECFNLTNSAKPISNT